MQCELAREEKKWEEEREKKTEEREVRCGQSRLRKVSKSGIEMINDNEP
jgi:hypothetical protein